MSEEEDLSLQVEEVVTSDPPPLSYHDIKNMVLILDALSTRGAFKGSEMENVGSFRNRLNDYVEYYLPTPVEESPEESEESE